jgi:rod shape-determining protein MreC
MALTDIRQRTTVLFIAVMLGHIILISAQVNSRSGVPLLEVVTFGTFAEVQRFASGGTGSIRQLWNGYIYLKGVRQENERLKRELGEVQIQLQQERAEAERTRQLERLLGFQSQLAVKTVPTIVIGAGASPDSRTVTIDRGTKAGVRAEMAVVAPTGVVGRVVTPTGHASKVQLLVDRNAGAGALVQRSRAQGIILGTGEDLLRMNYVSDVADVKVGDVVVTSGIDGIYPRGFTIGTIENVERGNGLYKVVRVRPSVDFNRLEEVLVVVTPPAQAPPSEGPS